MDLECVPKEASAVTQEKIKKYVAPLQSLTGRALHNIITMGAGGSEDA